MDEKKDRKYPNKSENFENFEIKTKQRWMWANELKKCLIRNKAMQFYNKPKWTKRIGQTICVFW